MRQQFNIDRLVAELGGPSVINGITGISQSTVYDWLRGRTIPSLNSLSDISERADQFWRAGWKAPFRAIGGIRVLDMTRYIEASLRPPVNGFDRWRGKTRGGRHAS